MRPENLLEHPLPAQKCTVGCPILDRFLAGGVPCGSVTELVGESGCGKTQLSLQLLLSAQLPVSLGGLSASSLYLYSELPFPVRRFKQLSISFHSSYSGHFVSDEYVRDNVFVKYLDSADQLFDVLLKLDSLLANPPKPLPIKLIVIDSIAALFRSEFENKPADLKRRSSLFFKIASKLKLQAKKYGIAVLITNQVVDLVQSSDGINDLRIGNLSYLCTSGRKVCPALGISWANCVNSRLFMSKSEQIVGKASDDDNSFNTITKREMCVVFAPHLPCSSCEYVIVTEGVFGIDKEISVSGTSPKSDASKHSVIMSETFEQLHCRRLILK